MTRDSQNRLSRINTLWSLLKKSQEQAGDSVLAAQRELLQRYYGAAYRYLLGAVRDEEVAVELFQEFALRFVRGDFRRANPDRGRFRDYLKTALIHLVADYQRAERDRPISLPTDYPAPAMVGAPEDKFTASWREELLNRTWTALARGHPTLHAVLLAHVEQPDRSAAERASCVGKQIGKPVSAGNARVLLHRAREKFADLLLEEVAQSLDSPTPGELRAELGDLRLAGLCEPALRRRNAPNSDEH